MTSNRKNIKYEDALDICDKIAEDFKKKIVFTKTEGFKQLCNAKNLLSLCKHVQEGGILKKREYILLAAIASNNKNISKAGKEAFFILFNPTLIQIANTYWFTCEADLGLTGMSVEDFAGDLFLVMVRKTENYVPTTAKLSTFLSLVIKIEAKNILHRSFTQSKVNFSDYAYKIIRQVHAFRTTNGLSSEDPMSEDLLKLYAQEQNFSLEKARKNSDLWTFSYNIGFSSLSLSEYIGISKANKEDGPTTQPRVELKTISAEDELIKQHDNDVCRMVIDRLSNEEDYMLMQAYLEQTSGDRTKLSPRLAKNMMKLQARATEIMSMLNISPNFLAASC